jgi:hypothetical protein
LPLALAAAAACAGGDGGWRSRPGAAAARTHYYSDNSGIDVWTALATAEQPVSARTSLSARALVDRISVERAQIDPGDPGQPSDPGGHPPHEPDAVSSASSTAGGGGVARKERYEGVVGVDTQPSWSDRPTTAGVKIQASHEPDYASVSGTVYGTTELYDRNVTVSAFTGYGHDGVDPIEPPPGERDEWPARHQRVTAGAAGTQIVSTRLLVSSAVAVTHQWGRLENPYRRALVVTSLFPEDVPGQRTRFTGYASLAWYLGRGTALHLRQGVYLDTWQVRSVIPEIAFALEITERGLLTARYRVYKQWQADFYQARYGAVTDEMTGDVRLGPITEHSGGIATRWVAVGREGEARSIAIDAGYDLALTDYERYATDVIIAHVLTLGVTGLY